MRNLYVTFLVVATLFSVSSCNKSQQTTDSRVRTIITTDGEVDDQDSFIRWLLYSDEMDIEGLVYSSSQWHWKGDGQGTLYTSETRPRNGALTDLRWTGVTWMQEMINKYAAVYENLKLHDDNYPSPEYLNSIIRVGNIDFEGDMAQATEGSDFIKDILLDDKEGPVYVQIWGGTNTLARALKSIQEEYEGTPQWDEIYKKVSDKTIIYTVLDQDITYTSYVAPNWPEIKVIYNSAQFWSFAYMWNRVVPDAQKPYMKGDWFAENILFNHGPLLAAYYTWGDGRQIAGDPDHNHGSMERVEAQNMTQYDFISEGDSPAYFFLLKYGLRSTEDPSYGGLGGRFIQSETNPNRWEDSRELTDMNPETGVADSSFPQVRWIEVLQNDFAARADWCVKNYDEANHAPSVTLDTPKNLTAKPGETIELNAAASDPDGDALTYKWWQYPEAGTYGSLVSLNDANNSSANFEVPADAQNGQTIHIILEVKDQGSPQLTRFGRVVVTVE